MEPVMSSSCRAVHQLGFLTRLFHSKPRAKSENPIAEKVRSEGIKLESRITHWSAERQFSDAAEHICTGAQTF